MMDDNMDMDMDIDLGPVNDEGEITLPLSDTIHLQPTPVEPDLASATPHKVHIRGVDDFATDDIRAFSAEHYPNSTPIRVEWIDDTSANIVFANAATALKALSHFSLPPDVGSEQKTSTLTLRRAKILSTHPQSVLEVRIALFTDQKRPRAHESSRFYLLHPEHDPRERRRHEKRSVEGGDYRRRRYGRDEHRRRQEEDSNGGFNANMYDDDFEAIAWREGVRSRGRTSVHAPSSGERSSSEQDQLHRGGFYGPKHNGHSGRLVRDRSASPVNGSDQDRLTQKRQRQRTPPPRYEQRDPHPFPPHNSSKELFPTKATTDNGNLFTLDPSKKAGPRELFPSKKINPQSKELFPCKAVVVSHRRSDAFDAADETADLFANGMPVPFVDGATEGGSSSRTLFDRITTNAPGDYGRLKDSAPDPDPDALEDLEHGGFNIRGAATQQNQGFFIRGIAGDGTVKAGSKELFPSKLGGNAGKELFSEKLQGRGGRRKRAEDMFG